MISIGTTITIATITVITMGGVLMDLTDLVLRCTDGLTFTTLFLTVRSGVGINR